MKKETKEQSKIWGARLEDSGLHERAQAILIKEGMTKSELVINAIRNFVEREEQKIAGAVLEREGSEVLPLSMAKEIAQSQQQIRHEIIDVLAETGNASRELALRARLVVDLLLNVLMPPGYEAVLWIMNNAPNWRINNDDANAAAAELTKKLGLQRARRIMNLIGEFNYVHRNGLSPNRSQIIKTDALGLKQIGEE
jgi:hypothetical protein